MSTCPTISVLMPVYNAERYVAKAVESILAQTCADFEFVIIDDGSTDGSHALLKQYAERDHRIRLISRANTGHVIALNQMLEIASGRYIARIDADDIALPDRFARQVGYLESHGDCVAVGSYVWLIDAAGRSLGEWRFECEHEEIDARHIAGSSPRLVHPATMLRTDALCDIGGYRPEMCPAEDQDLWLRLGERGRLANLPEHLTRYRLHGGSVSHRRSQEQYEARLRLLRDAFRRRGLDEAAITTEPPASESAAEHHRRWAWMALSSREVSVARRHALDALRRDPLSLQSWRLIACVLRGH